MAPRMGPIEAEMEESTLGALREYMGLVEDQPDDLVVRVRTRFGWSRHGLLLQRVTLVREPEL